MSQRLATTLFIQFIQIYLQIKSATPAGDVMVSMMTAGRWMMVLGGAH
jgi:hypothetical protein